MQRPSASSSLIGRGCSRQPAASRPLAPRRGGRRVECAFALDSILRPITQLGRVQGDLKEGIAALYDESSGLWESMWGEHMHHGLYPAGAPARTHQEAQVALIDETLAWAGVSKVTAMVDVGCGIGGSSRHILRLYPKAKAQGITLSPRQAARATELSAAAGLGARTTFQVADALAQPFPDASFDLVWSLESGEHMPDKKKFVGELARVCSPGGQVIIVTWCHRVLGPGEKSLRPEEQSLLDRVNEAYYLPDWCSAADYTRLLEAEGLQGVKVADWSEQVAPFWGAVIKSALTSEGVFGLLKAGWTTIKGALVLPLMAQGFKMGTIKFNLITATKPV